MENKKEETVYYGLVGRLRVEGKTYKEFTLNYLKAIIETYKELPNTQRLKAYIQYFVDNFSYDKKRFEQWANSKGEVIAGDKEKNLFNLCYLKKGTCEQFSQAFALLTFMDKKLSQEFAIYESDFNILRDIEMAHATNLILINDKVYIVDISSMIHCKEKDYAGKVWDYGLVVIDNYIENLKQNDIKIIPNTEDGKRTVLLCYKNNLTDNVEEYFDILTLPAETINQNFKHYIVTVNISDFFIEQNV